MFDYILDNIDEILTEDMIIKMHKMLKRGTSDEDSPLYNVGGFKNVPNILFQDIYDEICNRLLDYDV